MEETEVHMQKQYLNNPLCKIEEKENKCFEPQPYVRTMTECLKYKIGSVGKEKDYVTRERGFHHMWMDTE